MSDEKTVILDPKDIADFRNIIQSKDGTELYHIGIIDYLQTWDKVKKAEKCWKVKVRRKDKELISAAEPNLYCKRFKDYMKH